MSKKKYTIVIIGNGKLALAWFDYLKQNSNVAELHFLIRSNSKNKIPQATNLHKKISTIQHPVDLFILAVSDRAILNNARKVHNYFPKSMVWHCSGTHALVSLPQKQSLKMVVYPMYSFNGLHQTNWTQIPLFTEGLNTAFKKQLFYSLFNKKQTHYPTSFKDRQRVHLAAVIAQNFSNMLLIWAESQLPKSFKNKKIWCEKPLVQTSVEADMIYHLMETNNNHCLLIGFTHLIHVLKRLRKLSKTKESKRSSLNFTIS